MILLQDVPDGYEYCFAGNGKCPKASSCLRAIAAQLLSESEGPQPQSVRAVNPFYVGSLSGSSTCARYRSSAAALCPRYDTPFRRSTHQAAFHRAPSRDGMLLLRTLLLSLPQGRAPYLSRRTAADSPGIQCGRHRHQA